MNTKTEPMTTTNKPAAFLVLSIWDGDAIEPAPISVHSDLQAANDACFRYVYDEASRYDDDPNVVAGSDDEGCWSVESEQLERGLVFGARVVALPAIDAMAR